MPETIRYDGLYEYAQQHGLDYNELCRVVCAALPSASLGERREPIPERVFWAPLADNFYSAAGNGMGLEFYRKWKPRRAEFPQGESAGWGRGSAHNPFKDPPLAASPASKGAGVTACWGLSSFCAEVGHKCRATGTCVYAPPPPDGPLGTSPDQQKGGA